VKRAFDHACQEAGKARAIPILVEGENGVAGADERFEANTQDRYASLFKTYIEPELGDKSIATLAKADLVTAYTAWQDRDGFKPCGRTLRHAHDLVRAMLNWAVSMDFVDRNVATKMTASDLPKAKKPSSGAWRIATSSSSSTKPRHRRSARSPEGRSARSRGSTPP